MAHVLASRRRTAAWRGAGTRQQAGGALPRRRRRGPATSLPALRRAETHPPRCDCCCGGARLRWGWRWRRRATTAADAPPTAPAHLHQRCWCCTQGQCEARCQHIRRFFSVWGCPLGGRTYPAGRPASHLTALASAASGRPIARCDERKRWRRCCCCRRCPAPVQTPKGACLDILPLPRRAGARCEASLPWQPVAGRACAVRSAVVSWCLWCSDAACLLEAPSSRPRGCAWQSSVSPASW